MTQPSDGRLQPRAAHRTVDCYALGEEDVDVNGRVKAMETALLTGPPTGERGHLTSAGFLMRSAATFAAASTVFCTPQQEQGSRT